MYNIQFPAFCPFILKIFSFVFCKKDYLRKTFKHTVMKNESKNCKNAQQPPKKLSKAWLASLKTQGWITINDPSYL